MFLSTGLQRRMFFSRFFTFFSDPVERAARHPTDNEGMFRPPAPSAPKLATRFSPKGMTCQRKGWTIGNPGWPAR
jgi:hypothetical protein